MAKMAILGWFWVGYGAGFGPWQRVKSPYGTPPPVCLLKSQTSVEIWPGKSSRGRLLTLPGPKMTPKMTKNQPFLC